MDLSNLPHHYLGGYFRNLVLPQPPHTRRRKRSYILPPTHNMHNTQNTDCVKKYRVDVSQIFQVCLSTEIQQNMNFLKRKLQVRNLKWWKLFIQIPLSPPNTWDFIIYTSSIKNCRTQGLNTTRIASLDHGLWKQHLHFIFAP